MSKLTESVDEQPIGNFFSAVAAFRIPYFQRAYRWKKAQFTTFMKDVTAIVDEEDSVHFLGAIITHHAYSPSGQPRLYDIVDGQQRLATTTIALAAIAKVLGESDDEELVSAGADILSAYIYITQPNLKLPSNLKFYPSKEDRKQFREIIEDVLSVQALMQALNSPKMRYLPVAGKPKGAMLNQYRNALRTFKALAATEPSLLLKYRDAIAGALTVVEIAIKDPTNSSKIFERLNYRGVKVSTGDLVRNDIFSRLAASDAAEIDAIHDNEWEPFYKRFPNERTFESYFFPLGLISNPNVKKSDVFAGFQDKWREDEATPSSIIEELSLYQEPYLVLASGTPSEDLPKEINQALVSLHQSNAPSSVYPFVMQVARASMTGSIEVLLASELIVAVENFLVRRAICGFEPTGLHAAFKGLWGDLLESDDISVSRISSSLRSRRTLQVVSDEEVLNSAAVRPVYGSKVLGFVLWRKELALPGDHPEERFEIEHVLPRSYKAHWSDVVTTEEHDELLDTIGNLVLLSPPENKKAKNDPYSKKKVRYAKRSMFAMPRLFAEEYGEWNAELIRKRSADLGAWIVSTWPDLA